MAEKLDVVKFNSPIDAPLVLQHEDYGMAGVYMSRPFADYAALVPYAGERTYGIDIGRDGNCFRELHTEGLEVYTDSNYFGSKLKIQAFHNGWVTDKNGYEKDSYGLNIFPERQYGSENINLGTSNAPFDNIYAKKIITSHNAIQDNTDPANLGEGAVALSVEHNGTSGYDNVSLKGLSIIPKGKDSSLQINLGNHLQRFSNGYFDQINTDVLTADSYLISSKIYSQTIRPSNEFKELSIYLHEDTLPGKNFKNYIDSHCFEEMPWGQPLHSTSGKAAIVCFEKNKKGIYLVTTNMKVSNALQVWVSFLVNYDGTVNSPQEFYQGSIVTDYGSTNNFRVCLTKVYFRQDSAAMLNDEFNEKYWGFYLQGGFGALDNDFSLWANNTVDSDSEVKFYNTTCIKLSAK